MLKKFFGEAGDFYRARISQICSDHAGNFEWEDGINYSGYSPEMLISEDISTQHLFRLEIVEIDNRTVHILGNFDKSQLAKRARDTVSADIHSMTKNEFDRKYLLRLNRSKALEIATDDRNILETSESEELQLPDTLVEVE